jgi:hypothetical protein
VRHLLAVLGGSEQVTPRSEVRGKGAIRGEKPLGVSRGLASPHAALPLPGRLVGILGEMVEISGWIGVAGAIAAKFTLSGIAAKALLIVIPIFASKNNAFEACCCMCRWGHDCMTHQQTRHGRVF